MIDSVQLKNKLGIDHKYSIVAEIPSMFRYNNTIGNIYVRDLMFDEIKSLGLYLNREFDINQLVTIMNDAIKITTKDGDQFDLNNLELVDFHYLLIVSSILTDTDASWTINKLCYGADCDNELEASFHYSEIEYDLDKDLSLPITLPGTTKKIKPALVKDYIALLGENVDRFIKDNKIEVDKILVRELLSYATSLEFNSNAELIDNFNLLLAQPKLTKIVKEVSAESLVVIKPFKHTCPKCGTTNFFKYDFSVLRGYL